MTCQEIHGYWTPPHTVASSVHAIASDRVTLPQTSIACLRRSLGTCMNNQITTRVRTAMGRLTKKSHRHVKCSVMKPPANGPTIEATPKDAPIMPWYLPRSTPLFPVVLAAFEATAVTLSRLPRTRQAQHPFSQDVA